MGKWELKAGAWHGDDEKDSIALTTTEDARFYGLSAPLTKPIDNTGMKELVIQYVVKHEQKLDCGGAYIKLLNDPKFDAESFGGDTEYGFMFGPDICGSSTRRTHVILTHNDKNHLVSKDVKCETDQVSHLYTMVVRSDDTFEILIDGTSARSGSIEEEFDILHPKMIKDKSVSKPLDWVDEKQIPDPDEKKPEGHDDVPETIPDPAAVKPEDWEDEEDGEWEGPVIPNPEFNGKWAPTMIANPDYKGSWIHPEIDNPEYKADSNLHARCSTEKPCTHIGFELWQVTAGTSFDDIYVGDSLDDANAFAEKTFYKRVAGEKKMREAIQEEEREERRLREEERKAAEDLLEDNTGDEEEAHDEL